jgi:hypothetical protein
MASDPATPSGSAERAAPVVAALAAGVLGPDHDPAVPGRMLAALEGLPSRKDRDQLRNLLRLLDSRLGALALTGRASRVSGLPPQEAEALL